MGHIMRKPVFVICEQQRVDHPAHPRSLISAFVVRCLDNNENLQLKAGTYTVSPTCQFAESVLSLHEHLFSPSFTLQERCHTDSVSMCTSVDVDIL